MAFANAFPGVCHSMAHKLGAFHHLPHGIANALLIRQVLRFNAAKVSVKMGTFSQYDHPHTLSRYAEVADCLKLDGNTDEEKLEKLINAITELMHKIGIHKQAGSIMVFVDIGLLALTSYIHFRAIPAIQNNTISDYGTEITIVALGICVYIIVIGIWAAMRGFKNCKNDGTKQ